MPYATSVKGEPATILFDGVCNLCNASVDFILKRDPHHHFRFASLQSQAASAKLAALGATASLESILLLENGVLYRESTAALRIARRLSGLWFVLYVLILVPRFLRDPVYRVIARNRYRWFGKKETCRIPTEQERALFLG